MIIERLLLLIASIWIIGATGSAINGPCDTDNDCGIIDTVCHKSVCECRDNFAVWFDSCVPLAHPRVSCTKKHDCHKTLGIKSMCTKKNQCACKAFHHLHMGQCVKNRDLHETCDHDHQCYCGADCQEKIGCIHKNCSCKAGHSPYKSRRCISDEPVVLTVAQQQIQLSQLEEEPAVSLPANANNETTLVRLVGSEEPKSKTSKASYLTSHVSSIVLLVVLMVSFSS